MGATDNLVTFPPVASSSSYLGGIEFVTTTLSSYEFFRFSRALPEKSPWVAKQDTDKAPCSFKLLVASFRVPAVSMISSMMMACFPFTFPTMCMLAISPAPFLCFMIMAKVVSLTPTEERRAWKFLALATPPASGDTTTMSLRGNFFCYTK